MATTPNSIITVQTPKMDAVAFSTLDATGVDKTLSQGASNGSKITGIYASCNDGTSAHLLTVMFARSAQDFGGAAVNIPINSGFANGVPAINMLSTANWPGLPVDSDGNPFIFLQSTLDTLVARYGSTLTTTTNIFVVAVRGDF